MAIIKQRLLLALVASLTLGLSPHNEPHIIGKIRWVAGGAKGMELLDWGDLLMHGLPWLFLIYYAYQYFFSSSVKNQRAEMEQLVNDKNTHLIDVREVAEFKSGAAPGAVNMPLSQLGSYVDKIKALKGPKVLYCRSGNRSGQALNMLRSAGITDLYNGGGLGDVMGMKR